jgi:uncharacterized protein YqgC (DUF456 family)
VYFVWAFILILANATAWLSNALTAPGNWLIVAFTAFFAWFFPGEGERGIAWTTVAVLAAIAAVGEILEFAASAAVAGKRGGSRRGMALAIAGTLIGSIAGAFLTLPIPVIGPVIGAIFGGAAGAFVGAWAGESWKGKPMKEGYHIATGAMIGRLLGTAGKLLVGATMVVIAAVDALV